MAEPTDTWEARVDQALKILTTEATRINRDSDHGRFIERLGCVLSGRMIEWWPDRDGAEPVRDFSPSFLDWERIEQHPYRPICAP